MKRYGFLFEKITSFDNIYYAYQKALKGKKSKYSVCKEDYEIEKTLFQIQDELINHQYKPKKYKYFKIYDPKERVISVADFKDRIVHHALINIIEPIFEKIFIYDSYATRKDKGVHKAVKRTQRFIKKTDTYLKIDIRKYFDSIDHQVLINIIRKKIKDEKVIRLIEIILNTSDISRNLNEKKGLPIGNLTSQFFANVYLNIFDHFVKENLKCKYYVRYMDDMIFMFKDKIKWKYFLNTISEFLNTELKLNIKEKSIQYNWVHLGIPFLGYRVFKNLIRIQNKNIKRMKKRFSIKKYEFNKGYIEEEEFVQSINGIIDFIKFADSLKLRQKIIRV